MNRVVFVGRVATDIELKQYEDGVDYCVFTLVVSRDYKEHDGSRPSDFIKCRAKRSQAKVLTTFVKKGDPVGIIGQWRTEPYIGDENKLFNYCNVESVELIRALKFPPVSAES